MNKLTRAAAAAMCALTAVSAITFAPVTASGSGGANIGGIVGMPHAALVIADLNAGPLREAVLHNGDMLLVGAADPLYMTSDERKNQEIRTISIGVNEK